MRWQGRRESGNVLDRRGMRHAGIAIGGGGSIILAIIVLLLGGNPMTVLDVLNPPTTYQTSGTTSDDQDEAKQFVSVVLADTEDVWNGVFADLGRRYVEPKLVLFRDQTNSACGQATSAVGPFYCPADQQVYIDLGFFDELSQRYGASGDFAEAYVVAHEVGHHVQNLLGIARQVHQKQAGASEREANQLSVRLELQADYLAGVFAARAERTKQILEKGDLDEALQAATAVGDDRLQQQGRGVVVPDSFTHGTSAQRSRWFLKGYRSGNLSEGDTFAVPYDQL